MIHAIQPGLRGSGGVLSQCTLRGPTRGPKSYRSLQAFFARLGGPPDTKTDRIRLNRPYTSNVSICTKPCSRIDKYWLAGTLERCVRGKFVRSYTTGKADERKQSIEGGKKPPLPKRILAALPTHENIYTIPNLLTFSRLLAAPIIGYLTLNEQHVAALALFVYAGATDLVDGWIARKWNLQTVVGTIIDPMADKTLMTVLTASLAMKGAMPLPLAALIIGRDVLLGLAAIYYRYISLPPPKTLARYWDFTLPSAEVHPTGISKVNTALQLGLIGWTMGTMAVGGDLGWWGPEGALGAMWYLVGTTTIWSGASYIYTKDAVKILTARKAK
ncbi:MAG: hypothetical protein Q9207_007043 [Kuettlingeria erythrocarpa]